MTLGKPLRELSATEIIDRSFSLYSKRFLDFLAPFFFAGLLNSMMVYAVRYYLPPIVRPERLTERFLEWLLSNLAILVGATSITVAVLWIVSTIASGMAVKYASDLLERGEASLTAAFNFTIYKLGPLLVAGLISGVLVILGLICFIVPGVIVAVMFSLSVPVIMIEDTGAFESLERSRRLVDRSWWKTFTVLLLVLFLSVLLAVIGEAISILFGPLRGVASTLAPALIQPIHALASTHLYYSMRIKVERLAPPVGYRPPMPSTPAEDSSPKFCTHCGQKLPSDAAFCPSCGNRINRPV